MRGAENTSLGPFPDTIAVTTEILGRRLSGRHTSAYLLFPLSALGACSVEAQAQI